MGADVRDGLALLADIEEPGGPDERVAGDFLEKVMDAFHFDGGLGGRAVFEGAEEFGPAGQFALEDGGDLVALGHDVVEKDFFVGGLREGLAEEVEPGGRDGHGLIGQDVQAGLDGTVDVLGFSGVVAGDGDDVAGHFLRHAVQEIGAGIDLFLPVGGVFGAGVKACDALEVLVQVRTWGRIDMDHGADLRIHALLNQAGMEMAGVKGDEADGGFGGVCGQGEEEGEEKRGKAGTKTWSVSSVWSVGRSRREAVDWTGTLERPIEN